MSHLVLGIGETPFWFPTKKKKPPRLGLALQSTTVWEPKGERKKNFYSLLNDGSKEEGNMPIIDLENIDLRFLKVNPFSSVCYFPPLTVSFLGGFNNGRKLKKEKEEKEEKKIIHLWPVDSLVLLL